MAGYNVGRVEGEIVVKYNGSGTKEATKDIEDFQKKTGNTEGALRDMSTGAAAAGAGILAGFAVALNAAASFEQRMSAVKAVSGATAGEMDALSAKALQLGKDTSFSATESASAIEELVKAGLSVDDVLNGAADATVALAAAGEISLPEAATIAANAMNQFGLSAGELPKVADLIAGAANASAIDVGDFGMSLSQAGAVANLVGLSFDDLSTAIALMGNAGIKGSDAGTSLKSMLSRLQPQTQAQLDTMMKLGIVTKDGANQFYDATGKIKSMSEIAGVLEKSLKGMTEQQKQATLQTLFGQDAIRAAAIIADNGAEGFNNMAKAMGKVTAADVAATRMDNLKGTMEELSGTVETIAIMLGNFLLPKVRDMAVGLQELLEKFFALPEGVQKSIVSVGLFIGTALTVGGILTKVGLGIANFAKNFMAVLGPVQKFVGPFLKAFVMGFNGVAGPLLRGGAAFRLFGSIASKALTALLGPVGIAIGIILTLVELGKLLYDNWEPFRNLVNDMGAVIQQAWVTTVEQAQKAWQTFVASFQSGKAEGEGLMSVFGQIGAAIREVWNALQEAGAQISAAFQQVVDEIKPSLDQLWAALEPVRQALQPVIDAIQPFLKYIGLLAILLVGPIAPLIGLAAAILGIAFALAKILPPIIRFVGPIISGLISGIGAVIKFFVDFHTTVLRTAADLGKAFGGWIKSIAGPIKSTFDGIINAVTDFWTSITGGFSSGGEQTKSIFQTTWEAIVNFFTGIASSIVGAVNGLIQNIMNVWNAFWSSQFGQVLSNAIGLVGDILKLLAAVVNYVFQLIRATVIAMWTATWSAVIGFFTPIIKTISDALTSAMNTILGVTRSVLTTVGNFFQSVWNSISGVVKRVAQTVVGAVSAAWNTVRNFTISVWNAVLNAIRGPLNTVLGVVRSVAGTISGAINTAWNTVKSATQTAWNSLSGTVSSALNAVLGVVRGIQGTIAGVFSGAASWLYQAGVNIIQGLLNGINNMINAVRSKLQELTDMIPKNKGPEERDKVLLENNGELIMQSLINGLDKRIPALKALLSSVTGEIPATVGVPQTPFDYAPVQSAPAPAQTNVDVNVNAPQNMDPNEVGDAVASRLVARLRGGV